MIKTKEKRISLHVKRKNVLINKYSFDSKLKHLENQIIFLWNHDENAPALVWIRGRTG